MRKRTVIAAGAFLLVTGMAAGLLVAVRKGRIEVKVK